jgi:hypothetical protein
MNLTLQIEIIPQENDRFNIEWAYMFSGRSFAHSVGVIKDLDFRHVNYESALLLAGMCSIMAETEMDGDAE